MKDFNKYNVAFAICPELKFVLEQESGLHYEVDTTQLQIASLLMFAAVGGWMMKSDFSFTDGYSGNMSFYNMVHWHNLVSTRLPCKLVKKVKLQRHKRAKKLVAQSMMVELV